MATVKILLEKHETEAEAHEMLIKSLTHHENGGEHQEEFHQPAARDVVQKMTDLHDQMWAKMLKEIAEVIEKEV